MAPQSTAPFSPAELSYIHTSLSSIPPIRPDGRSATTFRPLIAESDILPGANGSARICFADGSEAVVGVKAEVEKSRSKVTVSGESGVHLSTGGDNVGDDDDDDGDDGGVRLGDAEAGAADVRRGEDEWVEMSIEIPGFRDDDALPVFLAQMLTEALLADGKLTERLWINRRFHWKLYIDILLLSQPSSYPLPLLSLTTHLALLSTRLPRLKSELDEDPLFDDDWDASTHLYPFKNRLESHLKRSHARIDRPPITLLVMTVGENIIFDPSREELSVAESVLAISVTPFSSSPSSSDTTTSLRVLAIRTIDPPSRLTASGIPNIMNSATGGSAVPSTSLGAIAQKEAMAAQGVQGVWNPPRGGMKRGLVAGVVKSVVEEGGVGEEVLEALEGFVAHESR